MTDRLSGDDFSQLIYRTLQDVPTTDSVTAPTLGPSSTCSAAALMAGEPLDVKQRRHIKDCLFCARVAVRLASVAPPDFHS